MMPPLKLSTVCFLIIFAAVAGVNLPCRAQAAKADQGWDNTVTSLLATYMYGIKDIDGQGLSVQLQHSENYYRDLKHEETSLDAQSITFSYDGSSGLLGFSAGYIYTGAKQTKGTGKAFLGIDPATDNSFSPSRSWYMAFDLSHNYQFGDNLNFGIGGTTLLTRNPFDTEEGKTFSMLFNMPILIKDYITITPQFQWSRTLPDDDYHSSEAASSTDHSPEDNFYGGVSVSFSY